MSLPDDVGALRRLFIITGDYSGDVHAASVVRALRQINPETQVVAVGGANLKALGVELVSDQSIMGRLGLSSLFSAPEHWLLGRKILKYLDTFRPDAVLLIDYGMFNLWMAGQLKKRGIKVFYFIPPQVWASRKGRIRRIKAHVDHVFCIFPFEETLYRSQGIPVTYVGHPLAGQLPPRVDRALFCREHGLDPARPIVGLLPGSRKGEVASLMSPMVQSVMAIREQRPDAQFVLSRAASISPELFREHLNGALLDVPLDNPVTGRRMPPIPVAEGQNHALLSVADAVVAASGTVTLEAALYGAPTVIVYKLHPAAYFFYRLGLALNVAYLPCIGLPNILVDPYHPFVPELMQDAVCPARIAEALLPLLERNSEEHQRQKAGFEKIRAELAQGDTAANLVRALLAQSTPNPRFPVRENIPLPQ